MKLRDLTPAMLDQIAEMCNISAGHAAGALAQLMEGQIIRLQVPKVSVNSLDGLGKAFAVGMGGVLFGIDGPHQGSILILFEQESARSLSGLLLKKNAKDVDLSEAMTVSTLSEVGNILSSTFLGVLGQLTGWRLLPSVPKTAFEDVRRLLQEIDTGAADEVLSIEIEMASDRQRFFGHFCLIPNREMLRGFHGLRKS